MSWIKKALKSGAQILVRVTATEVTRRCVSCALDRVHVKHEDQAGNSHYFCKACGRQN